MNDIARIMTMKQSLVGPGCFIFDPNILVSNEGFIKEIMCEWRKVKHPKSEKIMIEFNFKNDTSWSYTHDYDAYISIVKSHIARFRENTYIIEFAEYRFGVQFFKITKNLVSAVPERTLSRIIHFPDNEKITVVDYFYWDVNTQSSSNIISMKKKTIRAPTRLIEDMKRFAYRAAENKFTPADIFNMACTYSQRILSTVFRSSPLTMLKSHQTICSLCPVQCSFTFT